MKPVSYQWMPSSVNGGRLPFDGVLAIPNVVHCEKPSYNPLSAGGFKKHLDEHTGTSFYRNRVSLREAEVNMHMKQPARKYPFSCPYCGQGYMRRLCLVKHIDRLHENGGRSGNVKPGLMAKMPQVPVSSAFPTLSTSDPLPLRPVVRVTVPTSSSSLQLCKDNHKDKTLDANPSHVANSNVALLPPLNGHVLHNRALTVSLPNEVSIPAGCSVELVEVKTVNGMKELKLRLVSKEENESVIKDTRTTASYNTTQEKQSPSTLPSANMSLSFGTRAINRTLNETSTRSVECPPAVLPVRHQPNQTNNNKVGLKRSSPGTINLDRPNVPPSKLPRSLSPLRRNSGIKVSQRDTASQGTSTSSVVLVSTDSQPRQNLDTCVSQGAVEERRNSLQEQARTMLPRRPSDIKSIPRDIHVRLESRDSHLKGNGTSSSILPPAPCQRRTSPVLVHRDNTINQRFLLPRVLNGPPSFQTSVLSNCTKPKKSTQKREVKSDERAGELVAKDIKSFPVISSVFSLSQQPGDVQGPIQPLVMALRGIVMDKSESPASTTEDHVASSDSGGQGKEMPLPEDSAEMDSKPETADLGLLSTDGTCESVKIEDSHKATQYDPPPNHSSVKTEKDDLGTTGNNKCAPTPDSNPLKDAKCVSNTASNVISSATAEPIWKVEENDRNDINISSKFLTVSLKRVQVGMWKKYKKGQALQTSKPKQQIFMDSLTKYAVLHLMPLSIGQMVKRPGPNQPVVVLNHPKPRASAHGAGADAAAHTGTSEPVPKCQILKMRLSKVMGQKYEVKGCTVGVSQ